MPAPIPAQQLLAAFKGAFPLSTFRLDQSGDIISSEGAALSSNEIASAKNFTQLVAAMGARIKAQLDAQPQS